MLLVRGQAGSLSVRPRAATGGDDAAGLEPIRRPAGRPSPSCFASSGHRGAVFPAEPSDGCGREVLDALREHGTLFYPDLQAIADLLVTESRRASVTAGPGTHERRRL